MPDAPPIARERLADFAAALAPRLSAPDVLRTDALSRGLYATDASMYEIPPVGVLVPRRTEDVQAAVEEAGRHGIPVHPRGSGSSLAGSAVGAGLVIDTTKHLNAVTDLDPEGRTVTVQPGVVLDGLNGLLAPYGLRFGPDPASANRATLGGMMGTNATGTHSILYGSVVDHVRSARAILADGSEAAFSTWDAAEWDRQAGRRDFAGHVVRGVGKALKQHEATIRSDTPRWWRRAGGYRLERLLDAPEIDFGPGTRGPSGTRNLAHLLCGSEGTLAFTTSVTLGLVERPQQTALAVVHFPTRRSALEATPEILETGPAAVELFDRVALHRARQVAEYAPRLGFVQGDPAALLIVEYDTYETGPTATAHLEDKLQALKRHLGPGATITQARTGREIADVWSVRKVGLGLAMSARMPIQATAFVEDAAVPVEHLADYITDLEAAMAEHDADAVVYAHASAGCLHVRPFLDLKTRPGVAAMERIAVASADLVKRYGGILASEHGDGLARGWLAGRFYGERLVEAYRDAQRAWDPNGVFSPGRKTDAPPMTERLRLGPNYAPRALKTPIAFLDPGGTDIGFAAVVEACNGQGVCRKEDVGVMCPPFMATREEKDSTRGRANALRLALTGALDTDAPDALDSPEVAAALDLCVSCKACQSECPASVDMGKLKSAWLHYRNQKHKPSVRTRLFAHLPRLARRIAGPQAALVNRVNGTGFARRQIAKRFGIAPERALPPFATRPFTEQEGSEPKVGVSQARSASGTSRPPAVLYADTFARFQEPHIARAAVRVMEAAGFEVVVPPYRCCGRTYLSKGFLDHAGRLARQLLDTLAPYAEAGVPVVGLEPSCILTLRDEIPALCPDDPRALTLAAHARTFEEWASEADEAGHFDGMAWNDAAPDVLVHGHCHQKARSSMDASRACLGLTGAAVAETEAGCCGMAGAFGYEAEHYAVSLKMAENRLAPRVREASSGTAIVAAGTSCRHQIEDVTGRAARHPAEILADALAPEPLPP